MKYWLKALFTPRCWLQVEQYSAAWDAELRRLLAIDKFSFINQHTAKIGGHVVWVANHPYGSFTLKGTPLEVRPSRSTILMAHDKMTSDFLALSSNQEIKGQTKHAKDTDFLFGWRCHKFADASYGIWHYHLGVLVRHYDFCFWREPDC